MITKTIFIIVLFALGSAVKHRGLKRKTESLSDNNLKNFNDNKVSSLAKQSRTQKRPQKVFLQEFSDEENFFLDENKIEEYFDDEESDFYDDEEDYAFYDQEEEEYYFIVNEEKYALVLSDQTKIKDYVKNEAEELLDDYEKISENLLKVMHSTSYSEKFIIIQKMLKCNKPAKFLVDLLLGAAGIALGVLAPAVLVIKELIEKIFGYFGGWFKNKIKLLMEFVGEYLMKIDTDKALNICNPESFKVLMEANEYLRAMVDTRVQEQLEKKCDIPIDKDTGKEKLSADEKTLQRIDANIKAIKARDVQCWTQQKASYKSLLKITQTEWNSIQADISRNQGHSITFKFYKPSYIIFQNRAQNTNQPQQNIKQQHYGQPQIVQPQHVQKQNINYNRGAVNGHNAKGQFYPQNNGHRYYSLAEGDEHFYVEDEFYLEKGGDENEFYLIEGSDENEDYYLEEDI